MPRRGFERVRIDSLEPRGAVGFDRRAVEVELARLALHDHRAAEDRTGSRGELTVGHTEGGVGAWPATGAARRPRPATPRASTRSCR